MKKIFLFTLILSLILSVGVISAKDSKSTQGEAWIEVEPDNVNYDGFFEVGKKYLDNKVVVSPRELFPAIDRFDVRRYDIFYTQLTLVSGYDSIEAKQIALDGVIQEVALTRIAKAKGIQVTDEEARKMAQEVRYICENPTENTYGINCKEMVDNVSAGLGITIDEYWNEFAIDGYKQIILQNRLKDLIVKNVEPGERAEVWNEFLDSAIHDFKNKNNNEIQRFKLEIENISR